MLTRYCLWASSTILTLACSPSPRREAAPTPSDSVAALDAGPISTPSVDGGAAIPTLAASTTTADAAPPPSAAPAPVTVKVKIVTIGMHVAGGPFDEPTKEPFKKAVEPHFPEFAQCWGKHVAHPPKNTADVGVDFLIEATGGHPKTSNHRSTVKDPGVEGFLPCVVAVFESVEFPKLDRGRTGVSYSLRFTP